MKNQTDQGGAIDYQIRAQGRLDEGWSDWLGGLTVALEWASDGSPVTTLTGPVTDQAALRGLLCTLWDLNLTLISVHRTETDSQTELMQDQNA
jgi:hypothetical protein